MIPLNRMYTFYVSDITTRDNIETTDFRRTTTK